MALASHIQYAYKHYVYRAKECFCSLCFRMVLIYIICLSSISCCEKQSWHQDPRKKTERHINIRDRQSKKTHLWSYVKWPLTDTTSWLDLNSLLLQSDANGPQCIITPSKHFSFFHPLFAIGLYLFLNASSPNQSRLATKSNYCSMVL